MAMIAPVDRVAHNLEVVVRGRRFERVIGRVAVVVRHRQPLINNKLVDSWNWHRSDVAINAILPIESPRRALANRWRLQQMSSQFWKGEEYF
jgi:hypothetical protein